MNMQFFLVANSCRDFIVLLNRIDIHFITTKRNLIYAFHPSGTAFLIACSCSALWASISFCLHFSWNAISIFLIAKKTGIPPNTNDKKRPLENKENTCNNHFFLLSTWSKWILLHLSQSFWFRSSQSGLNLALCFLHPILFALQ